MNKISPFEKLRKIKSNKKKSIFSIFSYKHKKESSMDIIAPPLKNNYMKQKTKKSLFELLIKKAK